MFSSHQQPSSLQRSPPSEERGQARLHLFKRQPSMPNSAGAIQADQTGPVWSRGQRSVHLGVQSEMCAQRKDASQWVFIRGSWRCLPCPHSQWTGSAATSGNTQGTIGESVFACCQRPRVEMAVIGDYNFSLTNRYFHNRSARLLVTSPY